jgi:vacuolar-type H+-ATPase subunit E/Vma4
VDTLESSIREESERTIRATKEREISEIKEMEEACAIDIENFGKKIETETAAKIAEGLSKLENKSILERKKFKLRAVEDFITHIVEDAVKEIRDNNPRYKTFLLDAAVHAAEQIQGRVEVSLTEDDRIFEKEMKEALNAAGSNRNIVIHEDKKIKWGGCIVHDEPGGRIFDNSIERIYFRKSLTIRREVMRVLKQQGFVV